MERSVLRCSHSLRGARAGWRARALRPSKLVVASARQGAKPPHPALTTRVLDGAEWVPLADARRLYDQGMEEGLALSHSLAPASDQATPTSEEHGPTLGERERMVASLDEVIAAARAEHAQHDEQMQALVQYTLALEEEVEAVQSEVRWAALAAAQEVEKKLAGLFQAALTEARWEDSQRVEESMHRQMDGLGHALRTAVAGKEAWRQRALTAEQQFRALKEHISATAKAASARRRRHGKETEVEAEEGQTRPLNQLDVADFM